MTAPSTGYFDLQANGFAGVDFQRPMPPEAMERAVAALHADFIEMFAPHLKRDVVDAALHGTI